MSQKDEILTSNNELMDIENIYQEIRNKIINARQKMLKHIDTTMTEVYWYVGKITSELFASAGEEIYGKRIVEALSKKLTKEFRKWLFSSKH